MELIKKLNLTEPFLVGLIFKANSLNLFSTEPKFRFREILNFRDLNDKNNIS